MNCDWIQNIRSRHTHLPAKLCAILSCVTVVCRDKTERNRCSKYVYIYQHRHTISVTQAYLHMTVGNRFAKTVAIYQHANTHTSMRSKPTLVAMLDVYKRLGCPYPKMC